MVGRMLTYASAFFTRSDDIGVAEPLAGELRPHAVAGATVGMPTSPMPMGGLLISDDFGH